MKGFISRRRGIFGGGAGGQKLKERMMVSTSLNKKYQALFGEFNQQYFGGRLPHYRIEVVDRIS